MLMPRRAVPEPRPGEQAYALVPDVPHPETNRWGQTVETVPEGHALRGKSLNINGDRSIGANPNRYKQHGFFFTADNCIGCHACEAACAEKNQTPPHLAFRSVGYLEAGAWPNYTRLNISMACNHCDDPVCLKGCPTRAYTKFAEYGAVLQDPDICFGCGYCTWVCPYNAPQLDPVAGHVSKCNMCVDRLEVGLKPACAAACLGGALDFGIIETRPDNRIQTEAAIPGFPDPSITHPNIRFQQTRGLPREMTRADSVPLRYVRTLGPERGDKADPSPSGRGVGVRGNATYHPEASNTAKPRAWNLKKLSTRENPLVVFTLVSQLVVGAFLTLFLGPRLGLDALAAHPLAKTLLLFGLVAAQTLALVLSTLHLGRPHRFYRAFNNLRYSPVSREVAGIAVFYNLLAGYALLTGLPALTQWPPAGLASTLEPVFGWGAAISGVGALWFMHRIYRISARPYWNHWQVLASFYGSMLALGPLAVGLALTAGGAQGVLPQLVWPVLAGLALEAVGLFFHARDMKRRGGEGLAAHLTQATTFGHTYLGRNAVLGLAIPAVLALGWAGIDSLAAWCLMTATIAAAAVAGRMIFYAVIVPTTMPGAFFWRNPAFREHARETGLARMPQAGVATAGN
jgi:DMSO reductase iron-sulfur subunit